MSPRSHEPQYSPRVDDALAFVADVFRHRVRKGSGVPYLTHLLQVMVTVAEHGGDEDQMIAGLLHDYLEDIEGAEVADVQGRFGPRVAHLVVSLTETGEQPKPPWEQRKRSYIDQVRGAAPDVKLLSAADKLHNAQSLRRALTHQGPSVWARFSGSPAQTLWFYREVLAALGSGWAHPLLDELSEEIGALHRTAEQRSQAG